MELSSNVSVINLLHHLAEFAPTTLEKGNPQFDFTLLSFWLGPELAAELLSVLNEVRQELVPQHAEDRDVLNAYWDELVCEVVANPNIHLEGPNGLDDLINKFGDSWKKPLFEFEVIYGIDDLAIGAEPIALFGVEFFAPTDEALSQRDISKASKDEVMRWSKEEGVLTLAVVRVEAASRTIAFEAGRDQVVNAVTLLKVSALRGLAGRTPTDELLQWQLSGNYLVKPVTSWEPSAQTLWGYRRQFGPLVAELGGYIRQGIELLKLDLLSDLPEDIHERILRSMYWIAHSATHEADDHKLVDLCTALEILLIPEGSFVRSKGNVIALRYNLLGGDLNPSAVRWMYNRRNDVVHGSRPLPVVGPQHTWHLRLVCYTTVGQIVDVSAQRPGLFTLQDLISTVETKENLTTFVERARMGIYEGPFLEHLVREAQDKLNRLNP